MDIGPAELGIVLLIALLIFGGAKLPQLARSMGQASHEFRKGFRSGADDDDDEPDDADDEPAVDTRVAAPTPDAPPVEPGPDA